MITDTELRYFSVAKRLFLKCEKETGYKWKVDFNAFISWFYKNSEDWSSSTYRQYRSSVLSYLSYYGSIDIIDSFTEMTKKKSTSTKKENRTSQKKSKSFSNEDFLIILKELIKSRSKYKKTLSNWLVSGLVTGLRPIEWNESELIENKNGYFLRVKNAKNSYGRSNGEYRTLNLSNISASEIKAITATVNELSNIEEKQFTDKYNACAQLLKLTTRKVFGKRKTYPSLYSTRHQFSANAKGSGFNLSEIAALMGHATNETATRHYGKKRDFEDYLKINPIEADVANVRDKVNEINKKEKSQKN